MPGSAYLLASGVETHVVDDDELYPFAEDAKVVAIFPAPSEEVVEAIEVDLPSAQVIGIGTCVEVIFNEAHSTATDRELQAFVALALMKNDKGSKVGHIRKEVILEHEGSVFEHLGLVAASDLL